MLFVLLHEESESFSNCFKRQNRGFESKTIESMTNRRFYAVLGFVSKLQWGWLWWTGTQAQLGSATPQIACFPGARYARPRPPLTGN